MLIVLSYLDSLTDIKIDLPNKLQRKIFLLHENFNRG